MRRAKIVCTIGPASESEEVLEKMIMAGMNVARLNFSHGTHEQHREIYHRIRGLSRDLDRPVAILQDLQGPKIRVGKFEDGRIELKNGELFAITVEDIVGNQERVGTTYPGLVRDVSPGDVLLLDDGLLRLRAVEVTPTDVITEVEVGGTLKNNKGINLPTAAVSAPSMTEKDKEDLELGLELMVDYVALSFVRSSLDIHQLRALIPEQLHERIKIISKIEKPQAVAELEEIVAISDGIMIARGDLGVELPPQKVPVIQKRAIRQANALGRLSITATQMLESMTENPRPTRAEASDVANAVLDGSDAVMLSGETAAGKYPVDAVQMMASIIQEVENSPIYRSSPSPKFMGHLQTFPNAVAKAASDAADEMDVRGIVVLTMSGSTARLMMTYRPEKPIIAVTPDEAVCRQMALYWGVHPHVVDVFGHGEKGKKGKGGGLAETTHTAEDVIQRVEGLLRTHYGAKAGDEIVVVMGSPIEEHAETNLMKFHRIT